MAIHIAAIVIHIRGYKDSVNVNRHLYQMKESYLYHIVGLINDIGICRFEGYDAEKGLGVSFSDKRDILIELRKFGVRKIQYRRKGIEKSFNVMKL